MPPPRRARGGRATPSGGRPPSATSRRSAPDPAARRRPSSDLLARIAVAVPAAFVAVVFVDVGGLAFALFLIAVGGACMLELYRLLERWRPVAAVGLLALAGMVLAARFGSARTVMGVALLSLPLVFLVVLARGGRGRISVSVAGTLLGVFWIAMAFAHAVLLRQLHHGGAVIIDILVGTFLGDTAAYLGGRLFGRRPLAPEISPNKTFEGLFCGMFVSILAVFFAGLYQDWMSQGDALLLGLAVAILGPLGDLFESAVKRDSGEKDAGSLFGPHGGALDRLDAVMFTIVAGYYVWVAVTQ